MGAGSANPRNAAAMKEAGIAIPVVGPDNRAGAAAVGRALAAKLAKGDPVAIIEGITTADNGRQRRLGFEDAVIALDDESDPEDTFHFPLSFTWALPPLPHGPDLLVLATELAGVGGPDLPVEVSATGPSAAKLVMLPKQLLLPLAKSMRLPNGMSIIHAPP